MSRRAALAALAVLALVGAPGLSAQERVRLGAAVDRPGAWRPPAPGILTPTASPVPAMSELQLGARVLLGSAGSGLGIYTGAVFAQHVLDCPAEVACGAMSAFLGWTVGSVGGAVLGVKTHGWITATRADTGPTLAGAAAGVFAGALTGGGVWAATGSVDAGAVVFALTQGTLAAMASVQ